MTRYLSLYPRDPVVARDGRPFGGGQANRMKSLQWPDPSVLAGSLRTLLGKAAGSAFDAATVEALKAVEVSGPFPVVNGNLFFPAPRDLLLWEQPDVEGLRKATTLRPVEPENGDGCDLPAGLCPVRVMEDVKPAETPSFWSRDLLVKWLLDSPDAPFPVPPSRSSLSKDVLYAFELEERTHVSIDPNSGAAAEGLLFVTMGIDLSGDPSREVTLAARVGNPGPFANCLESLDTLHPFGGERRLARWKSTPDEGSAWSCPETLLEAFSSSVGKGAAGVRLLLATPGLFTPGWRPGWIDEKTLEGVPPFAPAGLLLRLKGCCVDRWRPVSGWSLEKGKTGPKPVRRLVPAGSVYFFEVVGGNASDLVGNSWLRSVCDHEQDSRDGFGLALWGIWNN